MEMLMIFNIFFLFLQKIRPNFKTIKNRNICTRRASKECMYQVSSNSLHKRCFYSILNVTIATFQGIWTQYHVIPYIHFIPISMQQTIF